jgi:Bacterial Ig-like domain (group 3)
MKLSPVRKLALVTAALATLMAGLSVTAAQASTPPPWEPDHNTVGSNGTLSFYNASGSPVTGGNNIDHLFDYALASSADPSSPAGQFANLEIANPTPGQDPANWPVVADESSTASNSSAPGSLGTATTPLVTLDSAGAELRAAMGSFPPNTTAGYQNVFQIRLYTSGANSTGTGAALYWAADVQVTGTGSSATWTEVYPIDGAAPTTTSTQLVAAPVSPGTQHQSITFTATETAADATHPVGTMQFFDGNQYLGAATAVDSNGVASVTTSTLIPGTHNIKADFTPTSASYSPAPEATLSYLVNPVAVTPTIYGTVRVASRVTCSEPITAGESVALVWKLNGVQVATGYAYGIPASAYTKYLTCTATVNVPGGTPSSATSVAKKVAIGPALVATTKPHLYNKNASGIVTHGTYEYVYPGRWSPSATSFTYQWYVGTSIIRGATSYRYLIPLSLKGKYINCVVWAHRYAYTTGHYRTASVKVTR